MPILKRHRQPVFIEKVLKAHKDLKDFKDIKNLSQTIQLQ